MATTVDICNQVECYSIDHAPIMPTFAIPADFGTEEEYRARLTEQDLFDEFTRDEHGQVVMSEEEGCKKIEKLAVKADRKMARKQAREQRRANRPATKV
jgi:DNA polymerase-3 subunit alpha